MAQRTVFGYLKRMDQPTAEDLLDTLKRLLRERGLTYRQLGERIGLSESGVKKLFTGDDLSLRRLLSICAELGVTPEDALALARRGPRTMFTPDEAQSRTFERHPETLWFLWALQDADGDVAAACREVGLDRRRARTHLRRLEAHELVRARADGSYEVPLRGRGIRLGRRLGPPVMDPLHDALLASARAEKRCMDAADPEGPVVDMAMARLRLRRETALELREAMRDLLGEFEARARRERSLSPSAPRTSVGLLTVMAPFSLRSVLSPS